VVEEVRARKGSKAANKPRDKASAKPKNTVCTYTSGDATVTVSFNRHASDTEVMEALTDALGQARASVPAPRLAA
jgi:hypothetical protein